MSIEAQSQAENLHQNSSKQELESPRPATQKLKHPFISRQLPLLAKVADDEDQAGGAGHQACGCWLGLTNVGLH